MNEIRIDRYWKTMASAVSVLVSTVMLTGCNPQPAASGSPDHIIDWHDCRTSAQDTVGARLAAAGALCGEFQAPLDYADPTGRKITIAVARRPASDPAHRLGTLVVQTGGPGPSRDGVSMLVDGPEGGHPATAALAERYDLIGMDPRFFGAASPLECGWSTSAYLGLAQTAPADRPGFDRTVAQARELARLCEPQRELLPHASTRAMARDMDLLRTLLEVPKISYLGWSWGTYLGAVYLQMFGEHADRFVLDSSLDPGAPGPDLTRATAPAAAAALADWARWAAGRDAELAWGTTPEAVLAAIDAMFDAISTVPVGIAEVTITADMVAGLLLTVDDSDTSYTDFSAQLRALSDATLGHPVDPPAGLAAKLALYADSTVLPAFGFSATVANQCADRAARDIEDTYADIESHRAAEPMFGALARRVTPCPLWPVSPVEPATTIGNRSPALLVGAEGDPVAPVAGQRAMRQALPAARALTLDNAFRHGVYLFDRSACIDNAVEGYLLDGTLPATDSHCARDR
ncbi:alpha/beta hydrolase [Nocardia sp. MH4]|uniref:alpha/beta hydrolase n=1 Tax=Nocardia sp. MH4 TaxID=1768677 RepID=UPI001C502340|nr:alpha/beta hydrolase [Nocardia sp. MH4]